MENRISRIQPVLEHPGDLESAKIENIGRENAGRDRMRRERAARGLRATPTAPFPKHRGRQRRFTWEQSELATDGGYARSLSEIESRHPELSVMECRVCALAKATLPNWKIAQVLGICEKTVENHLRSTRMKLGLLLGRRCIVFSAFEIRTDPMSQKK